MEGHSERSERSEQEIRHMVVDLLVRSNPVGKPLPTDELCSRADEITKFIMNGQSAAAQCNVEESIAAPRTMSASEKRDSIRQFFDAFWATIEETAVLDLPNFEAMRRDVFIRSHLQEAACGLKSVTHALAVLFVRLWEKAETAAARHMEIREQIAKILHA